MINPFLKDKNNNDYFFAVPHSRTDYTNVPVIVSQEDLVCELQLDAIGSWTLLDFNINQALWNKDQESLKELWRPFQPREGVLNDRESVLIYGMEGDDPTSPTGLSQIKKKLGYKPKESEFNVPTSARDLLTCCHDVFNYFDPLGRTFIIQLNAGGFYPRHRDHLLLNRDTFRLIAFLGNSTDQLEWEVDGHIKTFMPNSVYYVDTRKMHRLSSWNHGSAMVVINVQKTWVNVLKVLSKLKHQN